MLAKNKKITDLFFLNLCKIILFLSQNIPICSIYMNTWQHRYYVAKLVIKDVKVTKK